MTDQDFNTVAALFFLAGMVVAVVLALIHNWQDRRRIRNASRNKGV